MTIAELVKKNRSYRRFDQRAAIAAETLRELVDLARCSASAANRQPLKFILSVSPESNANIFQHLHWAGYLKEWGGPKEGERPTGYIIMLTDTEIAKEASMDVGIMAQSMLLGAVDRGLGGCMLGAVDRDNLRKTLAIPDNLAISLVVALGKPAEKVVLEKVGDDGDIKYYRDAQDVHHVPKRTLDDLIVRTL
jgi:nitroreductase